MISHPHVQECHPLKTNRIPSQSADCYLLERLIGEGYIRQRLCLDLILNETCENIRCLQRIDYDPCMQTWINADTLSCECEIHNIPVVVHAQDICGQNICVPAMLQLRIPLHVTRNDFRCCAILRRLLLDLEPICVVHQCGNTVQIRADLCAQLYLTCLQKQPIGFPPQSASPCCVFPPLYPPPNTNKKDCGFEA